VLPPGNDEKGNPHKKRRLYTVASERGSQLALCVREVGVTSNFLHTIPKGSQLHLEGPMGKSMVLPSDPKAGLVLIGTSTGAATFRGFLRRLYPANAAPTAGRGPIVVILGGSTREAIPYVEEFEQAQERLGPGRFRLELALGGARVDDGSETTLPEKIKGLSLIAKEIMDRGGHTYVSGLRGMLKPCAAALDEFIDTKALKKEGRYHAEVY
jgi:sulfite reductase alpha subunit-like flavoprotein